MREPKTFVDVLRDRAGGRLARKGYTFLVDGDGAEARLDYQQLERRARAVGTRLLQSARRGDRALLVFDAGLDYVVSLFGCLYAGVLGVPVYPPSPLKPEAGLAHIDHIARDCGAQLALSSNDLIARLRPLLAEAPSAGNLLWLNPADALDEAEGGLPELREGDGAMVQYTSGSTSDPRGVLLTHANLLHNARFIREAFGLSEDSCGVSWLPPHHDMGLIGGIIEPLFLGAEAVLLPPQLFVQRPLTFLQAITRFRGTTCGAPGFGYDLLTKRIPESAKAQLDLSSWSVAFCGAEPVRSSTLDAFARAFVGCGFRREAFLPCYGLAEATLLVSASRPCVEPRRIDLDAMALEAGRVVHISAGAAGRRTLVSCGRPPLGVEVIVVDPDSRTPRPSDRPGEIWVRGPSVASSYWADAAATARTFDARLISGESGYLRTGDLGFLDDGELFITGRLKELIIIRGRNLYPQDVEATVEHAHPAVRAGRSAAFAVEIGDEESLVVVCEVTRRNLADRDAIIEAVRCAVAAAHGVVPSLVALLKPAQLPRTSSGKPRRLLSQQLFRAGRLGVESAHRPL